MPRDFPIAAFFPDLARGGHPRVHFRLTARMSTSTDRDPVTLRLTAYPGPASGAFERHEIQVSWVEGETAAVGVTATPARQRMSKGYHAHLEGSRAVELEGSRGGCVAGGG